MSRHLSPNAIAYNAAIDALNGYEDAIERLVEDRDRAYSAADVILPARGHGKRGLPRNPLIKDGALKAR